MNKLLILFLISFSSYSQSLEKVLNESTPLVSSKFETSVYFEEDKVEIQGDNMEVVKMLFNKIVDQQKKIDELEEVIRKSVNFINVVPQYVIDNSSDSYKPFEKALLKCNMGFYIKKPKKIKHGTK